MSEALPSDGSDDEASVRAIVRRMEDAWNRHDARAYGELFTEDAEWVNIVGMWWRGRPAIARSFEALHEGMFRDTPIHAESVAVRAIARDVRVAVVTWKKGAFVTPTGHAVGDTDDRMTLVVVRRPGGWAIATGQNTTIDREAQRHDPIAAG